MQQSQMTEQAIITGGTGQLGRVVVSRFLDAGYTVHVPWHSKEGWDELVDSIDDNAEDQLHGAQANLTDEDDVRAFMSSVEQSSGHLNVLLNLVGAFAFGSKVWEMELSTWNKMMQLNLTTAFLCSKHAIPQMQKAESGYLINVSSKAASDVQPGSAAYAVAKAGILTLTRALREELKDTNINVNAIMPGIIDTPVTRDLIPDGDPETWVKPDDIADSLLTLCSGRCDAVTGSVLRMFGQM